MARWRTEEEQQTFIGRRIAEEERLRALERGPLYDRGPGLGLSLRSSAVALRRVLRAPSLTQCKACGETHMNDRQAEYLRLAQLAARGVA